MKKSKTMKRLYQKPVTHILVADASNMICASVSVMPDADTSPGGSSSSWNNDEYQEGGTLLFGDETTIAPAKKGFFTMDED